MHPTELAALLAICTAMSFTPGPNTMLATAMAANQGFRPTLRFGMAVPTGWGAGDTVIAIFALMLACGLGLGALVLRLPALRWGVQLTGVAYLLWLAWRIDGASQLARVDSARLTIGFWGGVGLQFINIKAWMLALTLSAGWVISAAGQPATNPGERLLIVCALMVVFAFCSNASYALMGSLLRTYLAQGNRLLWFNRAMALVLVLTALWMLTV